jgi:hypothetical protein
MPHFFYFLFKIFFSFIIHTCIQGLGHFSPHATFLRSIYLFIDIWLLSIFPSFFYDETCCNEQDCIDISAFSSFGCVSKVGILGHVLILFSKFWYCHTFSIAAATFPLAVWKFQFLHILNTCYFLFLLIMSIKLHVKWLISYCGFDLYSLNTIEVEHLSSCLSFIGFVYLLWRNVCSNPL